MKELLWPVAIIAALIMLGKFCVSDSAKPTAADAPVEQQLQSIKANSDSLCNWKYSEDVDKMTSKKKRFARIEAKDLLQFQFPYDGGSTAMLIVRDKDNSTDIMLSISKGQFITGVDGGFVRIRFDDEQPKRFSTSRSSDGSADLVFISSEKAILSKLKTAQKMIIEAEFYSEGLRQMEFNIEKFRW